MWHLTGRDLAVSALCVLVGAATVTAATVADRWSGRAADPAISPAAADLRPSTDRQIVTLQNRLRKKPKDVEGLAQLGFLYIQKFRESADPGYYPRAEAAFRQASAQDPSHAGALAGLGALALSRHQFREALAWGEQARARAPYAPAVYGVIGDAQIELGDYPAAVASFQAMVDLRPDLNSYSRVSYARELHGDMPGAIDAMRRAAEAGAPRQESTAWTRVQLGHLYFNTGQLDAAEAEYRRALHELPEYLHALAALGRVEAARGNYPAAIELYANVTTNVPLPEYVIALGDVYRAAGQPDQAELQYQLVGAMQQLFAANGANTDLEMALFELDHDRDLDVGLRLLQAQAAWRASVKVDDALAWALYKNGDCREADRTMRRATRLGTPDALMFFHAGLISECVGRPEQARDYLQQALQLNPHFSILYAQPARQALARLEGGLSAARSGEAS